MALENLSGVPPQVTLSGLDAGAGGSFSGATQQGLGGGTGAYGGTPFGLPGGADLLSLLLQQAGGGGAEAGVGTGGDILQSLIQGSFGQQTGGLSAGSLGQTQPGYVAGQSAGTGPEGLGAGSSDPLAIIQKILGLAQKPAGALPTVGTASPTLGGTGETQTSLSDQLRSQTEAAGSVGTASPVVTGDYAVPGAPQGMQLSPELLKQYGLEGIGGNDLTLLNQLLGPNGGLWNPATGGAPFTSLTNYSPEAIQSFLQNVQATGGELLPISGQTGGLTTGTGVPTPSPIAGTPGSLGTNLGGVAQGGIGSVLGLLNLYQALQGGGSPQQGISGGLQTIGGLSQLLQSAPELASALGIAPGALGTLGAGAGGLGGLLGLATGIQGLMEGTSSPGQAATQLGGGALGTYGALSTLFPSMFPSLTGALGSALGATAGGTAAGGAAGLGAGVTAAGAGGALGATSAGAGAGAALGGLGAGATLGVVALPMLAAYLGVSIDDMVSAEAAMRRERARQQRFQRGLPTLAQDLQRAAGVTGTLTPQMSDEDLLNAYSSLNTAARNWEGGPATGNPLAPNFTAMIGGMSDAGRATQEQLAPYLAQLSLGRLRAEDLMAQRGLAIPGGGNYQDPAAVAKLLGGAFSAYDPESGSYLGQPVYRSTNPWIQQNLLAPSKTEYQRQQAQREAQVAQAKEAFGPDWESAVAAWSGQPDARGIDPRNIFAWSPEAQTAFQGIQPGGIESGVRQLLGLGSVNYGSQAPIRREQYGALGLPMFQATQAPIDLQALLAAANAPQASTNPTATQLAQGPQQGRLTEETLMDLLRRLSPGAAYAGV